MISIEKWLILTPLQKLLKNVGDLGKLIAARDFKSGPKSNKSSNPVTLVSTSKKMQKRMMIAFIQLKNSRFQTEWKHKNISQLKRPENSGYNKLALIQENGNG